MASSLEAKFGARSRDNRKNLGSSGIIPQGFSHVQFQSIWKNHFNSEFYNKLEYQTWKTGWKKINDTDTREYTAHEKSQRSTTQISRSYLKFKGQNFGHLSPLFLKTKFEALTRISEANFGLLKWKYSLGLQKPWMGEGGGALYFTWVRVIFMSNSIA